MKECTVKRRQETAGSLLYVVLLYHAFVISSNQFDIISRTIDLFCTHTDHMYLYMYIFMKYIFILLLALDIINLVEQ